MSKNMERLGKTLSNRMKKTSYDSFITQIDLGVVNDNMSITTDSLRSPIPEGEYMINFRLTGKDYTMKGGGHGPHDHEIINAGCPYTTPEKTEKHPGWAPHDHGLQEEYRGLKPGDRVLIAWCGSEPVVVCIVVKS